MRIYRACLLVPLSFTRPDTDAVVAMPDATRNRAINIASRLPQQLFDASNGAATCEVAILPVTTIVPASVARYRVDGVRFYVDPYRLAQHAGVSARYDLFISTSDPSQVQTHDPLFFRAIATERGLWFDATDAKARTVCPHEFGHWLEYTNRPLGYTNWPTCALSDNTSTSMHCAGAYGYDGEALGTDWYAAYYSASLPDNTGVNAEGWAIETPTERGIVSLPRPYVRIPATWGTAPVPVARMTSGVS